MRTVDDLFTGANRDERRHKAKVKEALLKQLPNVVTNKNLITAGKKTKVVVSVPILEDLGFRAIPPPIDENTKDVGMGQTEKGKVVGHIPKDSSRSGSHKAGDKAAHEHGVEISVDELASLIFEALKLPALRSKKPQEIIKELRPESRKKRGVHLDRKATLLEHVKRAAILGSAAWSDEDLRYKEFIARDIPRHRAVVVFVRDASGSINDDMTYTALAASWWIVKWLERQYPTTEVRFIMHGVEAEEVEEREFFSQVYLGGTLCSTGFTKALEVLDGYSGWNQYVVYYSDGDNHPSDTPALIEAMEAMLARVNRLAYGEFSSTDMTYVMQVVHDLKSQYDNLTAYTPLTQNTVLEFLQSSFAEEVL
jgi:uncharacterized sporulation protein YeaH/YhbH (DUF444 family)